MFNPDLLKIDVDKSKFRVRFRYQGDKCVDFYELSTFPVFKVYYSGINFCNIEIKPSLSHLEKHAKNPVKTNNGVYTLPQSVCGDFYDKDQALRVKDGLMDMFRKTPSTSEYVDGREQILIKEFIEPAFSHYYSGFDFNLKTLKVNWKVLNEFNDLITLQHSNQQIIHFGGQIVFEGTQRIEKIDSNEINEAIVANQDIFKSIFKKCKLTNQKHLHVIGIDFIEAKLSNVITYSSHRPVYCCGVCVHFLIVDSFIDEYTLNVLYERMWDRNSPELFNYKELLKLSRLNTEMELSPTSIELLGEMEHFHRQFAKLEVDAENAVYDLMRQEFNITRRTKLHPKLKMWWGADYNRGV